MVGLGLLICCCYLLMTSPEVVARRKSGLRRRDPKMISTEGESLAHNARYFGGGRGTLPKTRKRVRSKRPNIVFLLTDDQDKLLGSMKAMPHTRRLLEAQGAELTNAFVSTPMCCPSRSSLLTGLHVHNHHVYTNNDNCSSLRWQQSHEQRTFATYLKDRGRYTTGYFGKYLNEYDGTHMPPGWNEWMGLVKNSRFYGYKLNHNGNIYKHGRDYHTDYLTDLIANRSIAFFNDVKRLEPNTPVMMVLSFPAPHGPEDAAPQYQHMYANNTWHRTRSYDYAPNPDKQWLLQKIGKMDDTQHKFADLLQQKRLQTLRSVDDAVHKLVQALRDKGELDNTYLIYTSDHGYHIGQFGLVKGKSFPYDFDVRVPMYVRGPGVKPGVKIANLVLNVDHAPTLLDIANVPVPPYMDGRSYLPLLRASDQARGQEEQVLKAAEWRDTVLLERGKMTQRKLAVSRYSEIAMNPTAIMGKNKRIEQLCAKPEHTGNCTAHKRWVCVKTNNRQRIRQCGKCQCPDAETILAQNSMRMRLPRATNKRGCLRQMINATNSVDCNLSKKTVHRWIKKLQSRLSQLQVVKRKIKSQRHGLQNVSSSVALAPSKVDCDCSHVYREAMSMIPQHTAQRTGHQLPPSRRHKKQHKGRNKRKKMQRADRVGRKLRKAKRGLALRGLHSLSPQYSAERYTRASNKRDVGGKRKRYCFLPESDGMDCVTMDNEHWKVEPMWTGGAFCFCNNAKNNTYWCLRTINATHNLLYCEFLTGFISFYDMRSDSHQLKNQATSLEYGVLQQLHEELSALRACRGAECFLSHRSEPVGRTASATDRRNARRFRGF